MASGVGIGRFKSCLRNQTFLQEIKDLGQHRVLYVRFGPAEEPARGALMDEADIKAGCVVPDLEVAYPLPRDTGEDRMPARGIA